VGAFSTNHFVTVSVVVKVSLSVTRVGSVALSFYIPLVNVTDLMGTTGTYNLEEPWGKILAFGEVQGLPLNGPFRVQLGTAAMVMFRTLKHSLTHIHGEFGDRSPNGETEGIEGRLHDGQHTFAPARSIMTNLNHIG
jgi:hypothetical protein